MHMLAGRHTYYMAHRVGDLIKWVSHHDIFEASGDVVRGIAPVYSRGIVIEVSHAEPQSLIAHCFNCKRIALVILNTAQDGIITLSGAK